MKIKKIIGNHIRLLRTGQKRTQEELSASAGISLRFFQDIEGGYKLPSLITLFKISKGLKITPDKLIMPIWKDWTKTPEGK